jgi:hypothetical protein
VTDVWETIAAEAGRESALWEEVLLPQARREELAVFSPLAEGRFVLPVETIYEGYLVHYGRPRLFDATDGELALLLGDYLYAHGLVRLAAVGDVGAVADMAALISLCAQLRGEGARGDGVAWAATAAAIGDGPSLAPALAALRDGARTGPLRELAVAAAGRPAVERALAAHDQRVG